MRRVFFNTSSKQVDTTRARLRWEIWETEQWWFVVVIGRNTIYSGFEKYDAVKDTCSWSGEMNRAQWHRSVFAATVRPRVLFFFSISNALLKTFTIDSAIVLPSLKFVRKLYVPSNFIRNLCLYYANDRNQTFFLLVDQDKHNRVLKRRLSRGNHDEIITNVIPSFRSLFKRLLRRTDSVISLITRIFVLEPLTICETFWKRSYRRYQSGEPSARFQLFVAAAVLRKFKRNVTLFQQSNSSLCTTRRAVYACNPPFPRASSLRPWWCANGLRSTTVFIRTRTISYCRSNINRVERKRSLDKYLQTICNTIKFHPIHSWFIISRYFKR